MSAKKLVALAVLPFTLAACGADETAPEATDATTQETTEAAGETSDTPAQDDDVTTLEVSNEVANVTMTLETREDQVVMLRQTSVIQKELLTEDQLFTVESAIADTQASIQEIDGAEYSTEEVDGVLTETIVIPLETPEKVQQAISYGLIPVSGADPEKIIFISAEQTITALQSMGWTLVE